MNYHDLFKQWRRRIINCDNGVIYMLDESGVMRTFKHKPRGGKRVKCHCSVIGVLPHELEKKYPPTYKLVDGPIFTLGR